MQENAQAKTLDIFNFDKLWDYNNPAETEKKFRGILPEIKESKNTSAYLQLLTQIARTLGLQMKFDEAHKILDEVEHQMTDDQAIVNIRYLLERGRTFNSSKQKEKARVLFLKAYELGLKSKQEDLTVDAAHMMGIIEPYSEAQRWNEIAMEHAEKSNDEKAKGWLGSLYNNTAWNYHDNKEYQKALELFERNVVWHTQKNSLQKLIIAKWSVARALRSLNKIEEALVSQKLLLKEIKKKNLEPDGYVYEELAECNLIKGNNKEAKKYFGLAYDLLSKDIWFAEYEKERLERMKTMMQIAQ